MNYIDRDKFLGLIDKLDLKIGCEIGVYKGDYSIKILEKTNLSKLYLIDPWKHLDNYNDISNRDNSEFDLILEGVKTKLLKHKDRIEIIRDLSENAAQLFEDNYFDFIYLDADHSYEASKKDIELWYNKIKPGGIFSGHDYLNGSLPQGEFGVKQSVDEFVLKENLTLYTTGEDEWKSWFIVKPIPTETKVNVVMYCTENYYETSINLINTLNIFHNNLNIFLYQVNFKKESNISNVNVINLIENRIGDIAFVGNRNNRNNTNMFRAIFLKSKIILHSLKELKLNEVLYLDADLLPTIKLDLFFGYFKNITNYPLIQSGPAEYLFFHHYNPDGSFKCSVGNPYENGVFDKTKILEYSACQLLGIPIENRTPYSNASVVLYNSNCLEFIEEYDKINESTFDLNLEEINKYYPFADETTINVLLWKYKYNNRLPFLQVNINNIEEVKEFYYSYYENEKIYTTFTKIPSEKEKPYKYFFHGVKNHTSKEVSEFIRNFYLNNKNFKITYSIIENKIYIHCDSTLNAKINIYEWNSFNNTTELLYGTDSHFDNSELWFSTSKQLTDIKGVKIEIKYNDIVIKEEYFNFKTTYSRKIRKPVLISHTKVGIGDNLAATPTIKKISQIYNQKIILITYIPSIFINNPYVDEIVQLDDNNNIINKYNNNDYIVYNLFNLMNTNWRLIDHKQLCAYNVGLQLKPEELDMEFYPDKFELIENLPEKFICINPSETEPERTWGYKNWQAFIDLIQEHIPVVAIGKETFLDPDLKKSFSNITIKNGLNLLNQPCQNTISQAYHIISKSETFVTMNNGLYILSLSNLDNHITELATSWGTYFYRIRKGIENYNLDYVRGSCLAECLSNPSICVDEIGSIQLLKSGNCYLKKSTYECQPTPQQVYKSVLRKINKT